MKGNRDFSKKGKKTITIDLTNEEHMAFKTRANSVGLDMTKVTRQMIERYLNMDRSEIESAALGARREEVDAEILAALRVFAETHRENPTFLHGMDKVLGFKQGTLTSLNVIKL